MRGCKKRKKVLAIAVLTSNLKFLLDGEQIPETKIRTMNKSYSSYLNINTAFAQLTRYHSLYNWRVCLCCPHRHFILSDTLRSLAYVYLVVVTHLFCVWLMRISSQMTQSCLRDWTFLQLEHSKHTLWYIFQFHIFWEYFKMTWFIESIGKCKIYFRNSCLVITQMLKYILIHYCRLHCQCGDIGLEKVAN